MPELPLRKWFLYMQYTQLSLSDRKVIRQMLPSFTQSEIAKALGKHESTISRELNRNSVVKSGGSRIYDPEEAHRRRSLRKGWASRERTFTDSMKKSVANQIRDHWTPELISGQARALGHDFVSHEWIYLWIYRMQRSSLPQDQPYKDLWKYLPCAHRSRRKRNQVKHPRGIIPDRRPLEERPASATDRSRVGHVEVDLIVGKGQKHGLLVVADRKLRKTVIRKWSSRKANAIGRILRQILKANVWIKTLTFDNDLSFSRHQILGKPTFFTRPYCSQDKGTVEQRNKVIRLKYPKSETFEDVSDKQVRELQEWMNDRPMKLFGFKSPNEAHRLHLKHQIALAS